MRDLRFLLAATAALIGASAAFAASPRLVRDINTTVVATAPAVLTAASDPKHLFEFDGKLYFTADDGVSGRELWRSDGTSGGTQLVADINAGPGSSNPYSFFVLANKLYFFAVDGPTPYAYKMFATDGTTAGTHAIVSAVPRQSMFEGQLPCGASAVTIDDKAYLALTETSTGTAFWRTDGTDAGTFHLVDNSSALFYNPCWLVEFNGKVYFSAGQVGVGTEVFSAAPGQIPTLVADVVPGDGASYPTELTVFNGRLYFTVFGPHGWTIVSVDGVSPGAVELMDPASQFPNNLRVANGKLFFRQDSGQPPGGLPLIVSDGTPGGTGRLGTMGVATTLFSNGSRVFFSSPVNDDFIPNVKPWVSDGTLAGTVTLASDSFPEVTQIYFWDFHGATILQAARPGGDAQLWRTDGTVAGTKLLGEAGIVSPYNYPAQHQAVGQDFFYVADKDGAGNELYAVGNDTPLAANDVAGSVRAGQSLAINVLSNDSDSDGSVNTGSVLVVTAPAHGTALVATSGVVTYTANTGYAGADSFTYTVADEQGSRSAAASVSVTVTAPPASSSSGGGGGGGGLGLGELLLLGGVLALGKFRTRRLGMRRQTPEHFSSLRPCRLSAHQLS